MDDLGPPTAYLALEEGVPVYTSDGQEVGRVEHVLADPDADIFDGLTIDTGLGPGGLRFVDAPEVASLYERGVVLGIDSAAVDALPRPGANPGELDITAADVEESGLEAKLRRAWDYISGRY